MSEINEFRSAVEGFLAIHGMTDTEFGGRFAGDFSFVQRLRRGMEPMTPRRTRILEAMEKYNAEHPVDDK